MLRDYSFQADEAQVRRLAAERKWEPAFEELSRPLHEALYTAGTFDFLDTLSPTERFVLAMSYVQMQVSQGGFIQLIQNGYVSLLVTVIEPAQTLNIAPELSKTLDDALKVFVLNNEALSRETNTQEFALLYEEFREFEGLEGAFNRHCPNAIEEIVLNIIA